MSAACAVMGCNAHFFNGVKMPVFFQVFQHVKFHGVLHCTFISKKRTGHWKETSNILAFCPLCLNKNLRWWFNCYWLYCMYGVRRRYFVGPPGCYSVAFIRDCSVCHWSGRYDVICSNGRASSNIIRTPRIWRKYLFGKSLCTLHFPCFFTLLPWLRIVNFQNYLERTIT